MLKNILIFAAVLAAYSCTNNAQAACDWNNPGSNRFTGDQAESLNNYKDIPEEIRNILKKKINAHQFDDHITISRIGMSGKQNYTNGRDMHWGQNKMCKGEFSISKWNYMHTESALVYTYKNVSIAIPAVCGNVFRLDVALKTGGGSGGGGGTQPEKENEIPAVTPTEDTPNGGGTSEVPEVAKVNWPSENTPTQNSIVPMNNHEFMPAPPMPSFGGGNVPQIPAMVPAVPEPSRIALMLLGLLAVVVMARIKK